MALQTVTTPAPSQWQNISTAATVVIPVGAGAIFDGISVTAAWTGGTVTVYDNNGVGTAANTLISAAATTTANQLIDPFPQDGIFIKSGFITIVTVGTPGALNVLFQPSIP